MKKNIYKIPDNQYFDNLPSEIQKKIQATPKSRPSLNLGGILKPSLSVVALASCLFFFWPSSTVERPSLDNLERTLAHYSDESLLEYISYENIETDEMVDLSDENVLKNSFGDNDKDYEALQEYMGMDDEYESTDYLAL